MFFLEYGQFNNYLTATSVQQDARTPVDINQKDRSSSSNPFLQCTQSPCRSVSYKWVSYCGEVIWQPPFIWLPVRYTFRYLLENAERRQSPWRRKKLSWNQKDFWGDISPITLIILWKKTKRVPVLKVLKWAVGLMPWQKARGSCARWVLNESLFHLAFSSYTEKQLLFSVLLKR